MPISPQFRYFLFHVSHPIEKGDDMWKAPLPMNRKGDPENGAFSVSHGEYFNAARSFLEKDEFGIIRVALSQQLGQNIPPDDIKTIDIFLEKHGEFYHPARVKVCLDKGCHAFVLNVAVSDAGKNCIRREYTVLRQLDTACPLSFLPKVHGEGRMVTDDGLGIRMFLGEWISGYSEFHISQEKTGGKNKIVVWDTEKGNFFLPSDSMREVYAQAAMILTTYYNPETFEQIYPWHHAAGDFVVRCRENMPPDVRLITARGYTAMFAFAYEDDDEKEKTDTASMLEALLLFLLNLSVRMRLDRLDGIGDIVWADERALAGTLDGFFRGMAMNVPDMPTDFFQTYLASWPEHALSDLSEHVMQTYHPEAPELPVIRQHLKDHVKNLHQAVCHHVKQ